MFLSLFLKSLSVISLITSGGEMSMALTISLSREINIYLSTVGHVGLLLQLLPSVTESKLPEKLNGLTSIFLLRFSFLVRTLTEDVVEEIQEMLMNGSELTISLMRRVLLTKPMVMTMELGAQL